MYFPKFQLSINQRQGRLKRIGTNNMASTNYIDSLYSLQIAFVLAENTLKSKLLKRSKKTSDGCFEESPATSIQMWSGTMVVTQKAWRPWRRNQSEFILMT